MSATLKNVWVRLSNHAFDSTGVGLGINLIIVRVPHPPNIMDILEKAGKKLMIDIPFTKSMEGP